jgi:hypothetical protein
VAVSFHVKQVCWNYVEMGGVEGEELLEALRGVAKVAQLTVARIVSWGEEHVEHVKERTDVD